MSDSQPSTEAGRTPAADAAHQAAAGPPAAGVLPGRRALREAAKSSRTGLFKRRSPRPPSGAASRAGRNLPAAIGVGLALLVSLLVGMLFLPLAFVALTTMIGVVGVWEVGRALEVRHIKVPTVPAVAAGVALPFAAYLGGPEALAFATVASVTALVLWRSLDPAPDAARSIMAGTFVLLWVPFLLSFAMLLLQEPSGSIKVATLLLLVVANDTFGYLVGAFFGKHAMAPRISPKKSWEGFGGSIGGAMIVGVLAVVLLLDRPWWVGICLAVAVVAAATAGDLAESMIKRELGVKDMSSILPGHGGVMDRLDSIVFASPVAFLLSVTLVPGSL
ncbi:phosphatidate cytidylyltransferase [Arthrobacter sp.]|uniref:phosphatidate cytidylyltransferase n=1 Tax=Arthrobacter sp. TaxID=1667 RepID=UPI0028119D1C|nr:phosphatidate cytidylyltransferase [Arthrobacter sp.]